MDYHKTKMVKGLAATISAIKTQSKKSEVGHIIWIGAGLAKDAEQLLNLRPKKIVLADAIQDIVKKLKRRFAQVEQHVEISHQTISADGQLLTFYQTSPAKFSGLVKPIGINNLYPNAVLSEKAQWSTVSLNKFIRGHEINPTQLNILILDLNGYEAEILDNFAAELAHQFDYILVSVGKNSLTDTEGSVSVSLNTLSFKTESNESLLVACKDEMLIQLKELKEQLELSKSREQGLQVANAKLIENTTNLKSLNDKLERKLNTKNIEVSVLKSEIEESREINENAVSFVTELQDTADNVNKKYESIKAEKDSCSNELVELQKSYNNLQAELEKERATLANIRLSNAKLETEVSELAGKVKNLEEQLLERTKQRDKERHWHQENKKWAESLKQQLDKLELENRSSISELETENLELTRSARLNQKMLAKSQLDLDNLREKYAEKVDSESELIELIKELRDKLTTASHYYYQLQQDHPELLNDVSSRQE